MRLPAPPLLLITDRQQARMPLEDILAASFAGGCRWASVREKDLPPGEQVALAQRLRVVARDWNAWLTLHGDPALARLQAEADPRLRTGGVTIFGVQLSLAQFFSSIGLLLGGVAFAMIGPLLGLRSAGSARRTRPTGRQTHRRMRPARRRSLPAAT